MNKTANYYLELGAKEKAKRIIANKNNITIKEFANYSTYTAIGMSALAILIMIIARNK